MDFQTAYDLASQKASEALKASEFASDVYGCGTSFITIRYATNPKFYNWAKKANLLQRDAYYGAILDATYGLRPTIDGVSAGTQAEEFYNKAFCQALSDIVATGAFTHTVLN